MLEELVGVIALFTTHFREDGSISFAAVKPQIDWLIGEGAHGVAAGGSTGEGHVLDRGEYRELIHATVDAAAGRVPLVAGIIANSTRDQHEVIEAQGVPAESLFLGKDAQKALTQPALAELELIFPEHSNRDESMEPR